MRDEDYVALLVVMLGPWYAILVGGFLYYTLEWVVETWCDRISKRRAQRAASGAAHDARARQ